MKYLMLFEAFDSIKLSKVFSYLTDEGKNDFLNDLKLVSEYLDYPLSEFSDDDFKYLPFKKAWELNNPYAKEIEMFKFWFDKEGNYVDKTVINGEEVKYSSSIADKLYSDDINDYVIISGNLSFYEVQQLRKGQLVYLDCNEGLPGPAYIWRTPEGVMFALQNFADGSTPRDYNSDFNYRDIARFSWVILNEHDYNSIKKIVYKGEVDDDDNDGEYEFNLKADIYKRGAEKAIETYYTPVIKEKSNFALVLDITKLPQRSLSKLKKQRFDRKEGAFKTDDEIKSQNIKRYFNEIFKDEKIIADPNIIIKRFLIGEDFLFYYFFLGVFSKLYSIKNYYYYLINNNNDTVYINDIKTTIIEFTKRYNNVKKTVRNNINNIKDELSSEFKKGYIENSDYFEYIENIEELSKVLYKKLSSFKIKNIYDIEILYRKLRIFEDLLYDDRNYSNRLYDIIKSSYDISTIKYYLYDEYRKDEILKFNEVGFNRLKELIKRL